MKSNQICVGFNLKLETPFWMKLRSKLFRSFGRTPFRCFFKNFWELFSLRRQPYHKNFVSFAWFPQLVNRANANFPDSFIYRSFVSQFYSDSVLIALLCSSRTFLSNSQKRQLTIKVCPPTSFPPNLPFSRFKGCFPLSLASTWSLTGPLGKNDFLGEYLDSDSATEFQGCLEMEVWEEFEQKVEDRDM